MRKVMNGSVEFPMSERIADTIREHGPLWTYNYYVAEHGLAWWEFCILVGEPRGLISPAGGV